MTTRPLSVQLYSVRDHLAADLPGTIARLADIGFQHVEPFGLPTNSTALADALANAHLTAPTSHGNVLGDTEAALSEAASMGVKTLIEPYQPAERFRSLSDIRALADQLSGASQQAAAHGITIGYHNHDHEVSSLIDGEPALFVLAAECDQSVVFEVDLFWVAYAGVDPLSVVTRLQDRVVALHIKDGPAGKDVSHQVPAGQGDVSLRDSIVQADHALLIVEFDQYAGDLFEGIAQSRQFLIDEGVV
jgi:sugar phosphate isomerase/epimerase